MSEEMKKRIEELRAKNEDLKKRLEYIESDEFVEKEAREKLNMAKEEETVVILPEKLEIRDFESGSREENLPNWQQWLRLFF